MNIPKHLPPSYNIRWSNEKKSAVVRAVHCGTISLADVKNRYALGIREFREWEKLVDNEFITHENLEQTDNVTRLVPPKKGVEVSEQSDVEAA